MDWLLTSVGSNQDAWRICHPVASPLLSSVGVGLAHTVVLSGPRGSRRDFAVVTADF